MIKNQKFAIHELKIALRHLKKAKKLCGNERRSNPVELIRTVDRETTFYRYLNTVESDCYFIIRLAEQGVKRDIEMESLAATFQYGLYKENEA